MYASNFNYYRARSVADAHQLLAAHPGAKLLAGGHSLLPLLKLRLAAPPALVDIGRLPELRGLARQGDRIRIGALTTHAELAASPELRTAATALADAAAMVGDPAVRNRGTIGGNLGTASPAGDAGIMAPDIPGGWARCALNEGQQHITVGVVHAQQLPDAFAAPPPE